VGDGPIDPAQRRLAQRGILAALRRGRRRSPLRPDVRVDSLIAQLRAVAQARPAGHRGTQRLTLTDRELRAVVDGMVASGELLRTGHRVQLPSGGGPAFDPIMRERLDELLATLRAAAARPPPAETVAARLGIPAALLQQLRATGKLVHVAPRIDYPRETWDEVRDHLDRLTADGPLSVRVVRDELGTTRRHAESILHHLRRTPR